MEAVPCYIQEALRPTQETPCLTPEGLLVVSVVNGCIPFYPEIQPSAVNLCYGRIMTIVVAVP